jgi:hypothetical protein
MADLYKNNPFMLEQPEQEQNTPGFGGLNSIMNMMPETVGAGTTVGAGAGAGTFEAAGAGVQGIGGIGAGAGAGAGGGSAAGMGGYAVGGVWAALAAIIVGNEVMARKSGHRSKDTGEYITDIASTEVFNQDLEERWLPKIGIDEDTKLSKAISLIVNPLGKMVEFTDAYDKIKNIF